MMHNSADLELGRYMRRVLSSGGYATVYFEPHRDVDGRLSQHVFDVVVRPPAPEQAPAGEKLEQRSVR